MNAYVINRPNGNKWIQFRGHDDKRHTITLGKVPKKFADTFRHHVSHLLECQLTGEPPRPTTREWLSALPEKYAKKLTKHELYRNLAESTSDELATFISGYIAERTDLKPNSIQKLEHIRSNLVEFFGSRKLQDVTHDDADRFERFLKIDKQYAPATVSKRIKQARQLFKVAIKKRRLVSNPFEDIKASGEANESKKHFVERDDINAILEACPDVQWRSIIALCRYGGLRCPSEVLALKWTDISWDRKRFTATASKTEHHPGHGSRVVPLFPELAAILTEAFEQAPEGTRHVITRYRSDNSNLRTQLERIAKRAGVELWVRPFQNLRASRETELLAKYPIHVVCAWMGHSALVGQKHYAKVRDEDYQQAAEGDEFVRQIPKKNKTESKETKGNAVLKNVEKPRE